jgi:hypothetical protein
MVDLAGVAQPDLPRARPWGLLIDSAAKLNSDRWLGGIGFNSTCADPAERFPIEFCDYGETHFPDTPVGDLVDFTAFAVFFDQTCSALGVEYGWLADQTMNRAAVEASAQFAAELANSVTDNNPSFVDAAVINIPSPDPIVAFAALEGWLARRLQGAQGMIHVPPSVFFTLAGQMNLNGSTWLSPSGHIVVADAGYETGDPTFNAGMMYGSGMVAIGYDSPRPLGGEGESVDIRRNQVTARAVMEGIVAFDPCTVATVHYELDLAASRST